MSSPCKTSLLLAPEELDIEAQASRTARSPGTLTSAAFGAWLARWLVASLVLAGGRTTSVADPPTHPAPNVLFIAIDDLNDYALQLNPQVQAITPHLEHLARRGTLFTNAHCAAPVCNPSRVSVLTGVSPATSGVYINKDDWRDNEYLQSVATLPQHFRDHGYLVLGGGKLYHAANLSKPMLEGYFDPRPWHEYFPSKERQLADEFVPPQHAVNGSNRFYGGRFDWQALDITDNEMGDGKVVSWAEQQLAQQHDRPVFLSVGIYRPHIPWYTPQEWFDQYPIGGILLPEDPLRDLSDVPDTGVNMTKRSWHAWLVENDKWDAATQAYLASVSFADAMVGRLLQALDSGPWADNTIVMLWSDHGYHLGHKGHWEKRVLWEQATHVPLIVVDPRKPRSSRAVPRARAWEDTSSAAGSRCDAPVSLLDIYPTLCGLCDLPAPAHLEGVDLRIWLNDPTIESDRGVVTTYEFKNHSVRSQHWRYIRYADDSEELYDHRRDPSERHNLTSDASLAQVKQHLAAFLPAENAPQTTQRSPRKSSKAFPETQ